MNPIKTTLEGGGLVTTCHTCGWVRFHSTPNAAKRLGDGHAKSHEPKEES